MKIFIQIPCFNEELQLENAINEIKKSVDPNKYNYEIIIIDDGSTDKTVDIAKKNNVKNIISLKRNMGLGYAFNEGRKFAFEKEKFGEQKKQFGQELEQERYLGELDAKGEKEFIVEQINSYWDPMIEAETNEIKIKELEESKRADIYDVIVLGEDISDKYKILSNAQAVEIANDNARGELESQINPANHIILYLKLEWYKGHNI